MLNLSLYCKKIHFAYINCDCHLHSFPVRNLVEVIKGANGEVEELICSYDPDSLGKRRWHGVNPTCTCTHAVFCLEAPKEGGSCPLGSCYRALLSVYLVSLLLYRFEIQRPALALDRLLVFHNTATLWRSFSLTNIQNIDALQPWWWTTEQLSEKLFHLTSWISGFSPGSHYDLPKVHSSHSATVWEPLCGRTSWGVPGRSVRSKGSTRWQWGAETWSRN